MTQINNLWTIKASNHQIMIQAWQVWTQPFSSPGMVGSAAVSSGPLVDAISRWDVRKSHAAETAYKRQLLGAPPTPETSRNP
jgi:hypothetical protein